jgi:hypothetical protein
VICPKPTPRCGDLLRSNVALNPSQVIQRSNLSATIFFLISIPFVRNLHKLESLKPYTSDHNQNQSKGESRIRTQEHNAATTHTQMQKKERATTKSLSNNLENALKSLSSTLEAWSRSLGVVVCLKYAWCAAPYA